MQTINFAPYIGLAMVIIGAAAYTFSFIQPEQAMTMLVMGLGILGIHNSVSNLGRRS